MSPLGSRHGTHEWLVAVSEVGVDHVQVPLGDRYVHRFTDCPPRQVEVRTLVGKFHEVVEVFDGGVAATIVEVVDKRWPIGGREHGGVATNLDAACGVASMVGVGGGRAGFDNLAAHSPGEPDPLAVHLGTG